MSHCVKRYEHLCQIYQKHSLNMVTLRDPGLKFRIFFIFRLILYQVLGKVTKFGENWLKNKKVTGKKQIGGGSPPPPSAYRVNVPE